ncbi:uncharacterized protein J3D65DRAFT_405666 [Phyllosticta citribraziliensis]|uniref:Uncharacterized protein n=1 Tax=Phyllosticta citribraziliensis TaxID=989973 RepID=A0ABR1LLS5_9PEZI
MDVISLLLSTTLTQLVIAFIVGWRMDEQNGLDIIPPYLFTLLMESRGERRGAERLKKFGKQDACSGQAYTINQSCLYNRMIQISYSCLSQSVVDALWEQSDGSQ